MKKIIIVLMVVLLIVFTVYSCSDISRIKFIQISNHVLKNMDDYLPEQEVEFFDYSANGISIGATYYGYYYTANDEIMLPDFYCGNDYYIIKYKRHEANGGTYFGKPNNGTDWCFIKKITNHWYYYELHWA